MNKLFCCIIAISISFSLLARADQIVTITPLEDASYLDGNLDDVSLDDTFWHTDLGPGVVEPFTEREEHKALVAGEIGTDVNIRERQMLVFFKLPDLKGAKLERAELSLFLGKINHDNPEVAPLGPLSVWHNPDENDGIIENPGIEVGLGQDTGLDLVDASSETHRRHSVDVTEFVKKDYENDAGQAVSLFKFRVDNASAFSVVGLEEDNNYVFPGGGNSTVESHPRLVLTLSR